MIQPVPDGPILALIEVLYRLRGRVREVDPGCLDLAMDYLQAISSVET
jgi:hypothetical protein